MTFIIKYPMTQKPLFMANVSQDITERKQAEKELQKLVAVVKHSRELINLCTLEGKMTFLNEYGGKMLGIEPHEVKNVNIMEVIPDHLKGLVEKELLPALMKEGSWKGDLQYCNMKTGELTDVHAMTFAIKNPDTGEPQYLANVSLDITESKLAEEILRKNEAQQKLILNSLQMAFYVAQPFGNFGGTWVSEQIKKISGFSSDQFKNFFRGDNFNFISFNRNFGNYGFSTVVSLSIFKKFINLF